MDTLALAFPVSALLFMIILFLFQTMGDSPSFTTILWITVPLTAYLVSGLVMLGAQASVCGSIQAGKAFLGALPTAAAAFIGLGIAWISMCRIPIVSVVAPLFGATTPITKNGARNAKCCAAPLLLENIEKDFPLIKGMANGFYVFFAVLFGSVYGSGTALAC